ncbi:MAG TPA: division/cell wall cluster transcriptional repressor MraZ [Candidatus Binataceae bacterium]|nr:division/cell wall cluster transcriptional repressor MraZ [Candidatus Binataceae bacterium]
MFSGRFDHSVDEKGRVSIPARFREILQRDGHERLYITNFIYNRERCLALYPPAEWDRMVAKFTQRNRFDPQVQVFETFYIGGAHEVPVDRQGRILIPPRLREFASLGREVTFSARHDHFQLWDKAVMERVLKATEELVQEPAFYEKLNF